MTEEYRAKYQEVIEKAKGLLDLVLPRKERKNAALSYVKGLMSSVGRKNSWQLAEQAGFSDPYAFQHLLGRSKWDCDALRNKLHQGVPALLGKKGVLAIDETVFFEEG